ncbi:MAG: hypothetical protein ABIJ23_00515 [Candidatus Magasanikbacteria bacterium]
MAQQIKKIILIPIASVCFALVCFTLILGCQDSNKQKTLGKQQVIDEKEVTSDSNILKDTNTNKTRNPNQKQYKCPDADIYVPTLSKCSIYKQDTLNPYGISFEEAPEFIEEESPLMGKIIYKKVIADDGSYYYIIHKTEGLYIKVTEVNKEPFTEYLTKGVSFKGKQKPENIFEDIYNQDESIKNLLKAIDPNYTQNLGKKLTDQEMWRITKNLFDWYKDSAEMGKCPISTQYVNLETQNIDHLSTQAEFFKDTNKICIANCVQGGFVTYALLIRLGIPRDKLIVANLPGNWIEEYFKEITDENGVLKKVPDLDKISKKMIGYGINNLEDYFAFSAGHYYTALQIGNQWYVIDGLTANQIIPDIPTPTSGPVITIKYPHRVFIMPQKNNCESEYDIGCQEAPIGVPLITNGPQLENK